MTKELIVNACLAGFWAGVAVFSAGGRLDKAALFAAAAIDIRVAAGIIAASLGKPIPVDR